MAIYLELVDFSQVFKQLKKEPVILNDIKFYSEKERTDIIKKFLTEYGSDKISTLPQCECGELVGEYLLGQTCVKCNTVVQSNTSTDIEPIFWLRSPVGVAKLINPVVWTMMREIFTTKRVCIIDYLTHTKFEEPREKIRVIEELKANIVNVYLATIFQFHIKIF